MLALFAGATGAATTLHCTWLRSDGCAKAAVSSPKKILGVPARGATRGGAIRLYEPRNGVLGVAEGIETALSLYLLCKIPTWAAFCADNVERIRLPERLRELRIAIDIDESGKGRASAETLAKRVRRWSPRTRVIFMVPELDGSGDLNDELLRRAG
jgi:putative DNA primase/helicase